MTKDDILQLIRQGESFRLEAKRAEKEVSASVWESYSAWRVRSNSVSNSVTNRPISYNLSEKQEAVYLIVS